MAAGYFLDFEELISTTPLTVKKIYTVEILAATGWTLDLMISTLRVG